MNETKEITKAETEQSNTNRVQFFVINFLAEEVELKNKMCWCGCFQTHNLKACHHCGQDFKTINNIKRYMLIQQHANFYKMNKHENPLVKSLRWHYELSRRYLDDISFKEFKEAFEHVSQKHL